MTIGYNLHDLEVIEPRGVSCSLPCCQSTNALNTVTRHQKGLLYVQATLQCRRSTFSRMLQNLLSRACPGLIGQLSQQLQAAAYYSVQIVVPALGDSISDGEQACSCFAACWAVAS
jgi:hypothetical protein